MSHATLVSRQAAVATYRPRVASPLPALSKAASGPLGDATLVLLVVAAAGLLHSHRLPALAFVFICFAGIALFECLTPPVHAQRPERGLKAQPARLARPCNE